MAYKFTAKELIDIYGGHAKRNLAVMQKMISGYNYEFRRLPDKYKSRKGAKCFMLGYKAALDDLDNVI